MSRILKQPIDYRSISAGIMPSGQSSVASFNVLEQAFQIQQRDFLLCRLEVAVDASNVLSSQRTYVE